VPPGLSLDRQWYIFNELRNLCIEPTKQDDCSPKPTMPLPKKKKGEVGNVVEPPKEKFSKGDKSPKNESKIADLGGKNRKRKMEMTVERPKTKIKKVDESPKNQPKKAETRKRVVVTSEKKLEKKKYLIKYNK
jgi:hypothetical protein